MPDILWDIHFHFSHDIQVCTLCTSPFLYIFFISIQYECTIPTFCRKGKVNSRSHMEDKMQNDWIIKFKYAGGCLCHHMLYVLFSIFCTKKARVLFRVYQNHVAWAGIFHPLGTEKTKRQKGLRRTIFVFLLLNSSPVVGLDGWKVFTFLTYPLSFSFLFFFWWVLRKMDTINTSSYTE